MSNSCLYCGEFIPGQENKVEKYRKKYCNSSCAAQVNNLKGKHDNLFEERRQSILSMMQDGLPISAICKNLGVSRDTFLKRYPTYGEILKKKKTKKLSLSQEEYRKCQEDRKNDLKNKIFRDIELTGVCETGKNWCTQKRWLKLFLIARDGNRCSLCGWDEINPVTGNVPIHIDHIDGNKKNNHIGNVRILCPNCHSLTPTYGFIKRDRD